MNWEAAYMKLRQCYVEALVHTPRPGGDPFQADTAMANYPPRIHVDICYPVQGERRKEAYPGIGEHPILAELTDDELRAAAEFAMQFYGACGPGLKIYRDRRPAPGVVRYTIAPKHYEEWAQ